MSFRTFEPAAVVLILSVCSQVAGAESLPAVRLVADEFDNPCGVAVQPATGHVFVGAHKSIFRVVPAPRASRSTEIRGFSSDVYGKGPMYNISALGLLFLDASTLVVGGGGELDGSELVYFYRVGQAPRAEAEAIEASASAFISGPIKPGGDSEKGEGNFFALAQKGSDIFVTCNGDDTKGWIARIQLEGGKPGPLAPFIKSKVETGVDAPTGATICPEGKLVVSQLGEINIPNDSLLTVYDPQTGKLEKKLPTGLNDLVAVAYSPKSGKLYGLDFSWMAPDKGGLFLLEPGDVSIKASRIAGLDKPTAMAFAEDGTLYITLLGTTKERKALPGQLVAVEGL